MILESYMWADLRSCPSELMVSSPFAHYGLQAVQGSWELREKEELHPGRPLCSPLGCVSASQVGSELWLRNASEELRIGGCLVSEAPERGPLS